MNEWTVPWLPDGVTAIAEGAAPGVEYRASEADVEAFERDGVVLLEGAFADWVEPLRAGLDRNLAAPRDYAFPCESTGDTEIGRFFDSYCNWVRIPEYQEFVVQSCAAPGVGCGYCAERHGGRGLRAGWCHR